MAQAQYLKQYDFRWACPHVSYNPGEIRGLSRGEFVNSVSRKVQALSPLPLLITAALRKEKLFTAPEVTHAQSRLVISEGSGLCLSPREENAPYSLSSDYWIHPFELIDLPDDANAVGQLAVKIAEQFLSDVRSHPDFIKNFPDQVFERSIKHFQKNAHTIRSKTKPRNIEGTRLKVQFACNCSGGNTILTMIVLNRGEEVYSRKIRELRGGLHHILQDNWVEIENDGLRIGNLDISEPCPFVAFTELPDTVRSLLNV